MYRMRIKLRLGKTENLLIGAVVVVVILISLGVWHAHRGTGSTLGSSAAAAINKTPAKHKSKSKTAVKISLTPTKVPAGWSVANNTPKYITLQNSASRCVAGIVLTTTASSSLPTVEQAIKGIQVNGYSVTRLAADKLAISTNHGQKQLSSQPFTLASHGTSTTQMYAYLPVSTQTATAYLACPAAADLAAAKQAILAITISY